MIEPLSSFSVFASSLSAVALPRALGRLAHPVAENPTVFGLAAAGLTALAAAPRTVMWAARRQELLREQSDPASGSAPERSSLLVQTAKFLVGVAGERPNSFFLAGATRYLLARLAGTNHLTARDINLLPENLTDVSFRGVTVDKAIAEAITKRGGSLAGAVLKGNFKGANLRGADLRGAVLSGINLRKANLYEADLSGADLSETDLGGADLRGTDLRGAELRGADLSGADLRGIDLRGADLRGADLSGADLSGSNLEGIKIDISPLSSEWPFNGTRLDGSQLIALYHLGIRNFQGADLRETDLRGADLSGVNLHLAILFGSDLSGANLSGADLLRVNLINANLSGANLSGARFIVADLRGTKLEGITIDVASLNSSVRPFQGTRLDRASFNALYKLGVRNFYRATLLDIDGSEIILNRANLSRVLLDAKTTGGSE